MIGNVFAKRKQAHSVPCRNGEGSVVIFYLLELDGFLGGGINMAGMGEVVDKWA